MVGGYMITLSLIVMTLELSSYKYKSIVQFLRLLIVITRLLNVQFFLKIYFGKFVRIMD
ncbi:hypothetical protein MTR67_050798 [Solanum verrucosum]|uniref:Uncharacterized protein n=1 Tax=Solanum verrucosum TaxID=315347 RepID=A0AAF0V248_SOLVR|nr:hypothetical protein MTR67_050798 [Solanum verrucosum]